MKWKRIKTFDHKGHYTHWIFETSDIILHLYKFKPEFWLTGHPRSEIKTKDEWQFTVNCGHTWHVIPKELTTLEDKQAYVHTMYKLEEL